MIAKKRELIQWLGLLGVLGFLSFAAAVVFAPLAYPGYNWLTQAVSDLSASNAPSRILWGQLSTLSTVCGIVTVTLVFLFIQGKATKPIRIGVNLFVLMQWISAVGYGMFPLSDSGYAGTFTDIMHLYVVTIPVIVLSIASLVFLMIGGFRDKRYRSLAVWATVALVMMFAGAIGTPALPQYFGLAERFSVFSAMGFIAVLGVYLFMGFKGKQAASTY